MGNEIIIVSASVWEGLYIDGILEEEGREIRVSDLQSHLPIVKIRKVYLNDVGQYELECLGNLPQKLTEIPSIWLASEDDE